MPPLSVVGATYREVCVHPPWDQLYGSGLRAAIACTQLAPGDVELYTWCDQVEEAELRFRCGSSNVALKSYTRLEQVEFVYEHPLAEPSIVPARTDVKSVPSLMLELDQALVFGLLEAQPTIKARRLVFDPQAGRNARDVPRGSQELCVIANLSEARALLKNPDSQIGALEAARELRASLSAEAVVVKNGVEGAAVQQARSGNQCPATRLTTCFQ